MQPEYIDKRFVSALKITLRLALLLLFILMPFSGLNSAIAGNLTPTEIFDKFSSKLPSFGDLKPSFSKIDRDTYASEELEIFNSKIQIMVFQLKGKTALAASIKKNTPDPVNNKRGWPGFRKHGNKDNTDETINKITLGDIIKGLDSTPLDAFSLENVVLIFNPELDKTVMSTSPDEFPEPIQTILIRNSSKSSSRKRTSKENSSEFFLRKGINLIASINTQGKLDEILNNLKKIGLPLDNLGLQCCFGKKNQYLITRKGEWRKPFGINLTISNPTIMIRRDNDPQKKVSTLFQMVWGKVSIAKSDYFLFAERALSSDARKSGIAMALNGEQINIKTISELIKALPGSSKLEDVIFTTKYLPLDLLTITNPKWSGIPDGIFSPETDNFLLAMSTSSSISIPNSNKAGPMLIVNGTGKLAGRDLANLTLNLSQESLNCKADLKEVKVGPISMGSAKFNLNSSKRIMTISGSTGFEIKDFKVAEQNLSLNFTRGGLDFSAKSTLAGIGLGELQGSTRSFELNNKNSFRLSFKIFDATAEEILKKGAEAYIKTRDKLRKAGIRITEPNSLRVAVNKVLNVGKKTVKVTTKTFDEMFSKENWNDVGGNVKGLYTNAKRTVISITAGASAAAVATFSAAKNVGKGTIEIAKKIGDAVSYVAKKLNPFKKKKSKEKEKKPRTPYEYEVAYNDSWVRDQAHRCKTAASSKNSDGPVLRDIDNGGYIYEAAQKAAINFIRTKKMVKVEPYPEKSPFVTNLQNQPWWEVDLGKSIPVGAIIIKGGTSKKFVYNPKNRTKPLSLQVMEFMKENTKELEENGISGAILAVSETVKGDKLMDPNTSGVKWFKIKAGTEVAMIRPMADSKLFEKVLDKVEEYYPQLLQMLSNRTLLITAMKDMEKANAELVNGTDKVRYLRLFKPGKAILGIENFSVIHAKDTPITFSDL